MGKEKLTLLEIQNRANGHRETCFDVWARARDVQFDAGAVDEPNTLTINRVMDSTDKIPGFDAGMIPNEILGNKGERMPLSPLVVGDAALQTVARQLGIPGTYLGQLAGDLDMKQLREHTVRTFLARKDETPFLFRGVVSENGETSLNLRAMVPHDFQRIWSPEIVSWVDSEIGELLGDTPVECYDIGDVLDLQVLIPGQELTHVGDEFLGGLSVRLRELAPVVEVSSMLHRLVCSNGMVIQTPASTFRSFTKLTMAQIETLAREAMTNCRQELERMPERIAAAHSATIDDPDKVKERVRRDLGSVGLSRTYFRFILEELGFTDKAEPAVVSHMALANAYSALANRVQVDDHRASLQNLGGEVLALAA